MIKFVRIVTVLLLIAQMGYAQSEIYGRVTDEKKAGLDFASVTALEGGIVKGGAKTDMNGNFKIKPLAPGKYDLKVTYVGYKEFLLTGIIVATDKSVKQDVQMEKKTSNEKKEVIVREVKVKQIDPGDPGRKVVTGEAFKNFSSNKIGDLVGTQVGVLQKKGSQDVNINGSRSANTLYMIDGMMIRAGRSVTLPQNALSQFELMTNGLSAKYGNATGGIVSITTKGITPRFGGSLMAQHSIDGYNTNQVSLDMSGPLLKRKNKTGLKVPVLGGSLVVSATYDKDGDPSYNKYTRLKPDVLSRIQQNPLLPNPNGTGNFVPAAERVTASDFETIRAREKGGSMGFTYQGKLDYQPNENVNVTLGTYAIYSKADSWSFTNSMFAPEANATRVDFSGRGFLRLTQRLGKPSSMEKQDAKKSPISSAYYTLQFTYQKEYSHSANPNHNEDIFKYGYLGKFNQYRSKVYRLDTAIGGYLGQAYKGESLDSLTFSPSGVNPFLENYTKAIYNDGRFTISNVNDIPAFSGLRNGDGPSSAFSLWTGVGAQVGTFSLSQSDQVTINLDASFDIEQGAKNSKRVDPITHNIQFGLGYDQRNSSSYALAAAGLWNVMRLNTNRHFKNLDLDNPQFWVGGVMYTKADLDAGLVQFSPFDTIKYNQLYVSSDQSRFDKSLRQQLYGNITNTNTIDIDNLDPSTFKLDMFSADDLFNRGNDVVGYSGYDYLGNKLKKQPSFNDFWTKLDSRGDNERPIGAFRPIYMFGYVLDRFKYKDLFFNIGMRIDRYDANQKVLKDPYSLYGVRKVSDIGSSLYDLVVDNDGASAPMPSSFDSDYVPYVDNNQSNKPKIVGYRKGDVWYDPYGKEISDPTILSGLYANGLPIEPWLSERIDSTNSIKGKNFNPNNSFEDYKPQVAISPRVQFTFPISEEALFYGNYDVVTQNPTGNNFVTPDDYYFLLERQAELSNANLRMEKVIKYSLGYQQKITKRAALTVETFYQERKNQIQLQQFLLAYPITYRSYGNRDFSSTKGMTVKLDFRRTGPIRMNIDYTLQFAEGTGSSTSSQRSLLATGQPNLRSVLPLDFDSRHILNVSMDYRYTGEDGKNRGPKVGSKYPFENAGLNLIFRTNSGTPYTRSSLATPLTGGDFNSTPIIGTVNGSRLPWFYEFGLRVDKSFSLGNYGKYKKPVFLNVYTNIQNLFNTQNIISVYKYTGVGDDDGYLTSPQGLQALQNIQFKQSFTDLYRARLVNPGNYGNPRRMNVGLLLEF